MNAVGAAVDTAEFLSALMESTDIADELADCRADDRTVAKVIVDQIEYADLILLRGSEELEQDQVNRLRALLLRSIQQHWLKHA